MLGLLIWIVRLPHMRVQASHVQKVKAELLALAGDKATVKKHVAEIKKRRDGWWTDGRVGVTGDDYVFMYDLHDSHGVDNIDDVNIFYLPDEKRFIISHQHYCVDLSKNIQPANKTKLLPMFR